MKNRTKPASGNISGDREYTSMNKFLHAKHRASGNDKVSPNIPPTPESQGTLCLEVSLKTTYKFISLFPLAQSVHKSCEIFYIERSQEKSHNSLHHPMMYSDLVIKIQRL